MRKTTANLPPGVLAPANTYPSSACHCEPVRTLVWQSVSLQKYLASWQYLGRIRTHLRIRPKCCYFVMPCRKEYGLPRRSAPRNDNGGTSLHPPARSRVPHTLRAKHPCTRAHVLSSACHCEPVRTLVWQSASPQGKLTSWQYFGQIRSISRIRPKYSLSPCPAAGLRIATSLRSSQ